MAIAVLALALLAHARDRRIEGMGRPADGGAMPGLGMVPWIAGALVLIAFLADPAARGRAITHATLLGYMGFFVGPPVPGLVAEVTGLRASHALVAMALLGALALAARLVRADR